MASKEAIAATEKIFKEFEMTEADTGKVIHIILMEWDDRNEVAKIIDAEFAVLRAEMQSLKNIIQKLNERSK